MENQITPSRKPTEVSELISTLTVISIIFGIIIIVLYTLQWVLIDYLTPFCMGPLLMGMFAVLVVIIVISMIYFPLQFKKNRFRAILPLAINLVTFLIILFVPFTTIWLEIQFNLNWKDYNEVINLIEEGKIQVPEDDYELVLLPQEYRHLSKGGGEVMIDTSDGVTRVFFFTFRGILDNFSGYMYRFDDKPPQQYDFAGDWKQITEERPHWYFCASY